MPISTSILVARTLRRVIDEYVYGDGARHTVEEWDAITEAAEHAKRVVRYLAQHLAQDRAGFIEAAGPYARPQGD